MELLNKNENNNSLSSISLEKNLNIFEKNFEVKKKKDF